MAHENLVPEKAAISYQAYLHLQELSLIQAIPHHRAFHAGKDRCDNFDKNLELRNDQVYILLTTLYSFCQRFFVIAFQLSGQPKSLLAEISQKELQEKGEHNICHSSYTKHLRQSFSLFLFIFS